MNRQERFSLRKYKFGVASVLLGAVLVFGSAQASAEEQAASQTSAGTQLVATTQQAPAEEEHSQATEASTAVASEKVEVAKERYSNINNKLNLKCLPIFLNKDNINKINIEEYDYVVDACDSVNTKVLLMQECILKNIKIISSMGTAKKMDATKLSITSLDKTNYDKLAKKLRTLVDKKIQKKIKVVSSSEQVKDIKVLGSNSFVPATSGLLITNYIINDVIKK